MLYMCNIIIVKFKRKSIHVWQLHEDKVEIFMEPPFLPNAVQIIYYTLDDRLEYVLKAE